MSNKKYYTVWEGKTIGVFDNWDECREAVTGCKAIYKSFATHSMVTIGIMSAKMKLRCLTLAGWILHIVL